ncbi:hypothetical protein AB0873_20470 [Micromonospora sp. NPDC047707]|nr:hypothetical protein [Micromonospora sp. WMMC415]
MKDRLIKGLKKSTGALMVRRRRRDALVAKPSRSKRPGRLFQ